jgi:hypothetical protein
MNAKSKKTLKAAAVTALLIAVLLPTTTGCLEEAAGTSSVGGVPAAPAG